MALRKNNSRTFHRRLYGGILQKITLLKRLDDQKEGTVKAYTLYQCRRKKIAKHGEAIQGEMSSDMRTTWVIPRTELQRVGIQYINALDRIVDYDSPQNLPRFWQPESGENILVQLFENVINLDCQRVDPPVGK